MWKEDYNYFTCYFGADRKKRQHTLKSSDEALRINFSAFFGGPANSPTGDPGIEYEHEREGWDIKERVAYHSFHKQRSEEKSTKICSLRANHIGGLSLLCYMRHQKIKQNMLTLDASFHKP